MASIYLSDMQEKALYAEWLTAIKGTENWPDFRCRKSAEHAARVCAKEAARCETGADAALAIQDMIDQGKEGGV